LLINPIDAVPGSPNAMDDEFTGETVLNSKWTTDLSSGGATQFINSQSLYASQTNSSGDANNAIYQTAPGSTPWTVVVKFRNQSLNENYHYVGLSLGDGTGKYIAFRSVPGFANATVTTLNSLNSENSNVCSANPIAYDGTNQSPSYFSIQDDGTNFVFSYSANGLDWKQLCTQSRTAWLTSAATRVGLWWGVTTNPGSSTGVNFYWFRRTQ
jgi:hypothetical protein